MYHWERANPLGASAQLRKGLLKLAPYGPCYQAIDVAKLYRDSTAALTRVEMGAAPQYFRIEVQVC
jgi:hypothetical protein